MRHHSMKMFSTELGINMRTGSGEAGVTHHISSSERHYHFGKARAGGAVERRPERHQTPPESLQIHRRVAPARKAPS